MTRGPEKSHHGAVTTAPDFPADPADLVSALRAPAREAPVSGIVEIMKYGRARGGVMGLWAGEGDTPTPAFIVEATNRALAAGAAGVPN